MSNISFNDNPANLFGDAPAPAARRQTRSNVAADGTALPNAQFWLNVGYYVQVPSADNPDVMVERLVSLPMGLPLDTMQRQRTDTSSAELNNLRDASNTLLEAILKHVQSMNPGETKKLTNLHLEVRRVGEKQGPTSDNPFKSAMPSF